jgi:hypothetical protein
MSTEARSFFSLLSITIRVNKLFGAALNGCLKEESLEIVNKFTKHPPVDQHGSGLSLLLPPPIYDFLFDSLIEILRGDFLAY